MASWRSSEDIEDPGSWSDNLPYSTVDLSNLQLSFSENGPTELMIDSTENTTQVLTPVDQQDAATSQPARWSKPEVIYLLQLYKENMLSFADPKTKKKAIWNKISKQMNSMGYPFSGTKCETKIKNLKQTFTKTVDHNNITGNDRKTCPYYDELSDIFGMSPTVRPISLCSSRDGFASTSRSASSDDSFADPPSSSSESANSHASDADNIDGAESLRRGKNPAARKRKATSSSKGSDLVDVFNSYREERKAEEAEKQAKLAQMHEDKMKRFDRLLNVLEKM